MLLGNLGDTRSFSLVHNLEQYLEHKRFEYLELVALFQGEFFCVVLNILYHIDFPIVLIQKLFGCIGLFPRKRYKILSIYLYLYHLQTEFIISVVMIIIFIILIFNIVIEWKTKPWCGSCGQCELFLFNSWGLVFMNTPMGKHKLSGESPDDYRKLQSEERHRPRKA